MNTLKDSGMQTENEREGGCHNALSVYTPATLRDVFIEQQRQVRTGFTASRLII